MAGECIVIVVKLNVLRNIVNVIIVELNVQYNVDVMDVVIVNEHIYVFIFYIIVSYGYGPYQGPYIITLILMDSIA